MAKYPDLKDKSVVKEGICVGGNPLIPYVQQGKFKFSKLE